MKFCNMLCFKNKNKLHTSVFCIFLILFELSFLWNVLFSIFSLITVEKVRQMGHAESLNLQSSYFRPAVALFPEARSTDQGEGGFSCRKWATERSHGKPGPGWAFQETDQLWAESKGPWVLKWTLPNNQLWYIGKSPSLSEPWKEGWIDHVFQLFTKVLCLWPKIIFPPTLSRFLCTSSENGSAACLLPSSQALLSEICTMKTGSFSFISYTIVIPNKNF